TSPSSTAPVPLTAAFPASVSLVTSVINCRFQLGSYTIHRTDPLRLVAPGRPGPKGVRTVKKVLVSLGIVLVVQSLFALCLISALKLLVPRDMPFAVTGSSRVVNVHRAVRSRRV
ncbi:hypothetical protein, partial [Streptomyces spongiae]|uniref:hypothetical protein n=1 Tax=Streptomyces spongiae TaxID=565072 RepID=UPI001D1339BC